MKQYYFRRGVASLMALLALSLLSLRALADEAAPQPAVTAESSSSDSAPAPAPVPGVLISRSEMADLPAGSEAEITVSFRNLGDVTLKSPVAAFTPADGISLAGGASSFLLEDIPGGGTGSVTLKVRAADSASAVRPGGQAADSGLRAAVYAARRALHLLRGRGGHAGVQGSVQPGLL